MKKLLLGSVALIVMSAPVLAADMPVKARPLPPAFSWTGCYIGLNIGYAWAKFDKSSVNEHTPFGVPVRSYNDFDFDDDGVTGGAQIGCNWQYGATVWGLETDINLTSIEARTVFDNAVFHVPNAAIDTNVYSRLRWFGTARGRLGWTWTPTSLLYITGGLAYGQVNSNLHFADNLGVTTGRTAFDSQTHVGWTVGVGAEAKITESFSAKLEYLYVDLGSKDYFFDCRCTNNFSWDQQVQFHVVRLGLNYQFNWYAPVVARF